jgi:hypothetical protein
MACQMQVTARYWSTRLTGRHVRSYSVGALSLLIGEPGNQCVPRKWTMRHWRTTPALAFATHHKIHPHQHCTHRRGSIFHMNTHYIADPKALRAHLAPYQLGSTNNCKNICSFAFIYTAPKNRTSNHTNLISFKQARQALVGLTEP